MSTTMNKTTKEIIEEMERKLEEYKVSKMAYKQNDTGADYIFIYDLQNFVMKDFIRKLIESVAEEIVGEDEDYRGHSAVNDFKAKQRLKVKEIIEGVGK